MWKTFRRFLSALVALPELLPVQLDLLREQNALLRELIQFHTRRAPQTPYSQANQHRLRPPQPIVPRTDRDVTTVSVQDRQQIQAAMEQRVTAPWRTDQQLPAPETFQLDQQLPEIQQPLPSGSAMMGSPTVE